MSSANPIFTVRPGRGWSLFLLGLLLAIGISVPAALPAAVPERSFPPPPTGPDPPPVPPLWMPVAGAVVRGFDARAGPYGPGHRGIDITAAVAEPVRSPTAGRVAFAGPVAGANWVSLLVAPEVLVTVGPLSDPVTTAEQVRSRAPVGRVGSGHALPTVGRTGPGREGATLHLSVRVDGVYVDPLAYLIDRPRPRLAPLSAPGGLGGG
jgi:murein DD-endopeptidase MepM/ murein hydrolase activator NlpD